MKKLLTAVTAIAVLGLGAPAFAQDDFSSGSSSKDSNIGGSGSMEQHPSKQQPPSTGGSAGSMMGGQELSGKVLKASKDEVTLEYQGAAIPFTVKRDTSFQGIKSARELKEGQQVRANFELSPNNKNELKSIEVVGGTGGTGSMPESQPPSGAQQPSGSTPPSGSAPPPGSDTQQQNPSEPSPY